MNIGEIKSIGSENPKLYALVGKSNCLINLTDTEAVIVFRGQNIALAPKYLRRSGDRIYLSAVYIETRKGRNPAHLFTKKPQTDRER